MANNISLTLKTDNQSVDQIPGQSSSTDTRRAEVGDNSAPNKRLRTQPVLNSVNRRRSGPQSIRPSNDGGNSSGQLAAPTLKPVPVSANHPNLTSSGRPQLSPANSRMNSSPDRLSGTLYLNY